MSSYEGSSLTEIEAVLDGLDEATSADVYDATRGYSPKALAAVAASRADAAGGGAAFPGEWTVDPDTGSLTITLNDDVVALTLLQGAGATVPALLVKDGDGDTYMFAQPDAIRLGGSDALPGEVQVDSSGVKVWGDTSNDSNPVIRSATGEKIGFFGASPAVRPSGVAVDAAAIHAALVTLGLISA